MKKKKKKKKIGLKGIVKFFSVDFNPVDTKDVLDIHKYLMKRKWYKIMFKINKKVFIVLLSNKHVIIENACR